MSPLTPEQRARQAIDQALTATGWRVQDEEEMNLAAGQGVAVREFPMASGHGKADYLLFLEGQPVGALEAKKVGHTLTGVELQTKKYSDGLPAHLRASLADDRPRSLIQMATGSGKGRAALAKHTFGFFNRNPVMEYHHEDAVADGVNVDFDIYRIRTRITATGSTIEAGPSKTLIFAKDDSHAEDIVDILREEFGRGNDFCTKITYKSTGKKPEELIQDFRTGYNPRIAVTVDMIATGTDVRPIEIVMFLRTVKSRVLYEQMKGRGGRVVKTDELRSVTPDARVKTHFVLIDCVGVSESPMNDTRPLDRKKFVPFKNLLRHVSHGGADPEMVSSLASSSDLLL